MPAITVKNIPDPIYENLKLAAQAHHRSINSEIIACLEKELMIENLSVDLRLKNAQKLRARFNTHTADIADIQSAIQQGRP